MTRLAEMFNVNHFIVSQVNPHVVPFLLKDEDSITQEAQQSTSTASCWPSWLHSATYLAKAEALHRMRTLAEIGIFPNALTKAVSVLSQKYSGDITIFPEISLAHFPRMLSNPTPEFMDNAMLCGERATWPKLSRVKNHCAIELALDDAVRKLMARVVFSPSQVDLRVGLPIRSRSDDRKDRRGHRRDRPLSQNSAPATAPPHQPNQSKVARPKTHRKTRSTTTSHGASTLLAETALLPIPTHSTSDHGAANALDKVTSSDADETSNLPSSRNSSSSTLSFTSPFDSPSSPPSSPTKVDQSQNLFTSKSGPTTPSGHRSSWGSTSSFKSAVPPSRPSARPSPIVPTVSLAMTPKSSTQSLAEPRQERLYHPPMIGTPRPQNEPHRSQPDRT